MAEYDGQRCRATRMGGNCWQAIAVLGVLSLTIMLWGAVRLEAGSGTVVRLPGPGSNAKHGIQVRVDGRGADGYGYRPFRVTLSRVAGTALGSTRTFRVEIGNVSWNGVGTAPKAIQTIELPQGSRSVTVTMAVPQSSSLGNLSVKVFERGRRMRGMDGWQNARANTRFYNWSEATPSLLIIDADAPDFDGQDRVRQTIQGGGTTAFAKRRLLPDVRGLALAIPGEEYSNLSNWNNARVDDQTTISTLESLPKVDLRNPSQLSDRWIDYSGYDLILIPRKDLAALARNSPQQVAAIRRWMMCGKALCVYDAGDDYQNLGQLEDIFSLPEVREVGARSTGWRRPDPRKFGDQVVSSIKVGSTRRDNRRRVARVSRRSDVATDALSEFAKFPPTKPPFMIRQVGLGKLVAVAAEDPFPGSGQKWSWMLHSIGAESFKPIDRIGASQQRENPEYWEWLIPGVGQAPVLGFGVLITVFAVAIGPVNYFLLKRLRRLYLLLFTVPLGAALVTFSLLGYAVLTDGLGTKVRVRSVATLDQTTGEFASQSRQTYYASIAPSRGLQFPTESIIFPVYGRPYEHRTVGDTFLRRVTWGERQQLDGDYLRSRVTSQFVVHHAGQHDAELVISNPSGQPPTVENMLAPRIFHLMLRDESGELFYASGLQRGETAVMEPSTDEELSEAFGFAYKSALPQTPGNLDIDTLGDSFVLSWVGSMAGGSVDNGEGTPSLKGSQMEKTMIRYVTKPKELPKGTYVALVDQNPLTPIGVRSARQLAGFHVIVGKW